MGESSEVAVNQPVDVGAALEADSVAKLPSELGVYVTSVER